MPGGYGREGGMKERAQAQEPLAQRINGGAPKGGPPPPPLTGRVVAIVHPAWHSCGSHQVFVAQARAYRSLGAKVVSLAIADTPGSVDGSRASKAYLAAAGDLDADARIFAGMPLRNIFNGGFRRAGRQWMHGNYAAIRIEIARLSA